MKTTQTKHVRPLSPFGGRGAFSPFGGRGALLLLLWGLGGLFGGFSAYAQTIILLGEDFDKSEVTFSVTMSPATHTWVFVDYTTTTPADMSRATFTSVSPGTLDAGDQGFWLTGSATVTAQLKNVSGKFSWCAYAINVPPNAEVKAGGGYTLRGTPPFLINGNIPVDGYDFGPGTCISSITDLTCNPAGFLRTPPMTVTASAPTPVCADAVTFTATASGGVTDAMSYTWNIAGAETTTTSGNPYITTLATTGDADTYTYTVYVTNANSCTSTVSEAGTVTVYAVPAVTNVSSATVCSGMAAALSVTASNVTMPATYTWIIDGYQAAPTTTSTYTTPALTTTTATAYITYTVRITNATGCMSAVATGTITVNAVPTVTTTSPAAICGTGAVTLTAAASGGTTTAMTYTWKVGAEGAQTTTANTYSPTVSAGSTYSVTVTNANGCVSAAATGTITVHAVPAAPTGASSNTRCGTGNVTFSATTAFGCTIDWYTTSDGSTLQASGVTSLTVSLTAPSSRTYYAQSRNTATECVSAERLTVHATAQSPSPIGSTAHVTCGCVTGATVCGSTCVTDAQYTTDDGACTGQCNMAYTQLRSPCGAIIDAQYGSYSNTTCSSGCPEYSSTCTNNVTDDLRSDDACRDRAAERGYKYYRFVYYPINEGWYNCYVCN